MIGSRGFIKPVCCHSSDLLQFSCGLYLVFTVFPQDLFVISLFISFVIKLNSKGFGCTGNLDLTGYSFLLVVLQRPADIIKRKKMSAVWFPYTSVERLYGLLSEMRSSAKTIDHCDKLQKLLHSAMLRHLKQVIEYILSLCNASNMTLNVIYSIERKYQKSCMVSEQLP
jgi:hypothetical protein